jgi:hypothetical protein
MNDELASRPGEGRRATHGVLIHGQHLGDRGDRQVLAEP